MAQTSDDLIKEMFQDIGPKGKLKLRIFHSDNISDQKPWIQGGLSFGKINQLYGSCDAGWYLEETWVDSFNNKKVSQKPVLIVEGTDCLNTGSSGSAQYQRFFHVLGAVLSGCIGIYYLKKGYLKLRYDIPLAACNVSIMTGTPYFVITEIDDLKDIVESIGNKGKFQKVRDRILNEMKEFFVENAPTKYVENGNLNKEEYIKGRSFAVDKNKKIIKILSTNYINLTNPSKRGAHILLGEYLVAKYCLNKRIWILLPRLTHQDIKNLNKSNKKEWKILWDDTRVITLEDLDGIEPDLIKKLLDLKDQSMKGGDPSREKWNDLLSELIQKINTNQIFIKKKLRDLNTKSKQTTLLI